MDFKTFLENFDAIAQAPNGIQKLRSLILNLAIRGKLVPQNPEDKPASGIVKQVQEIRKAKRISDKKSEKLEIPDNWELPSGWFWSCLQELGEINPKNDLPDELKVGFVPMTLVPTDYRQVVDYEERQWGEIKKGFTHFANGDVGIAKITPCFQNRKSTVFSNLPNNYGAGTTELLIFRSLSMSVDPKYVLLFLKTPLFIDEGVLRMTGTAGQQRVPRDYFAGCAFPLPPLPEQKRIVEKVDELMALCDRLQQSQERRDTLRQKLRASAIDSLMNAETDEELKQSWAIVRDNWHTLSQKPEDVGDLRRSVLQLAVRGKLVFQNSSDEPASELLARVKTEKQALLETGVIRKEPLSPLIKAEEKPFLLPTNWDWIRGQDISIFITSGSRGWAQYYSSSGAVFLRIGNLDYGTIELDLESLQFVEPPKGAEGTRTKVASGDILISITGDTGMVGFVRSNLSEAYINQHIALFRPSRCIHAEYIARFLTSDFALKQLKGAQRGIKNSLGLEDIRNLVIAFPPLAEQKRIVTEVDELMQMCDRLEESLRQSQQRAEALAASAISHLQL